MTSKVINEAEYLADYDSSLYKKPNMAVDTAIFSVFDGSLHVLLTKRSEHPFDGQWSLVGGFVDIERDTDILDCARRKLFEKTSVKTPYLEQVGTVGNAIRDPRGWAVSTFYFALLSIKSINISNGDASQETKWSKVERGVVEEHLAFDHNDILKQCFERLRSKVLYTDLPVHLMEKMFSLSSLQKAYEIILGEKILHKSFRRRMLSGDLLIETGELERGASRPAMMYRLNKSASPHYFLRSLEASAGGS